MAFSFKPIILATEPSEISEPPSPSPVSTISILSYPTTPAQDLETWSNMSQTSSRITDARTRTTAELEVETVTRHAQLYISSGDVTFLVEDQLFRVHRYFLVKESVKFRDMLSVPTPAGTELMGASDGHPIMLFEITKEEFSRFLWVWYNEEYTFEASIEHWASVLRLAHMWGFAKVKALAVREMDKLDIPAVDKAVWAREFAVDSAHGWLESAYAALGAREAPITKAEGSRLGLDVVLGLAEVRERIRKRRYTTRSATSQPAPPPILSRPPPPGIAAPLQLDTRVSPISRGRSPFSYHSSRRTSRRCSFVSQRCRSTSPPFFEPFNEGPKTPPMDTRTTSPQPAMNCPIVENQAWEDEAVTVHLDGLYTSDDVADVRAVFSL